MSSHLRPTDTILVFQPEGAAFGGLDEQLKARLSGAHRSLFVRTAERFTSIDPHTYGIDPGRPEDYRRLFSALEQRHALPTHVLHAGNCVGGSAGAAGAADALATLRERLDEELGRGLYAMLALVQAKLAVNPSGATRCVFAFTADEAGPRPHHEAVNGLARALTTVDHRFELATVQIDRCDAATAARRLVDELTSPHHRNGGEVRYQDGNRYSHEIQRLEPAPHEPEPTSSLPLRADGVYLVTGGCGGLGMLFARYLARSYRARLVLSGRAPLDDEKRAMLEELSSLGGRAAYVRADVGDAAETRRLLAAVDAEFGGLDGIFHCAGIADRTPLARATFADFDRVLRPKVHGTLHLDLETRDRKLDVFVLFSSVSALVGDFGAGSYSAANFFLDRFAEARERMRRSGLRAGQTLSVNWPLWQDGGMRLEEQDKALYFEFSGMGALGAAQGLAAFEDALRAGRPQLLVMSGDRKKIDRILQVREPRAASAPRDEPRRPDAQVPAPPRASGAAPGPDRRGAAASSRPSSGQGDPARPAPRAALRREQLVALTRDYLRRMLAQATKIPVDKIHADKDLEVYGINSLMIMELNSLLDMDFDSLPRTLFFEYKSLAELAAFFVDEHEARLQQLLGAPPASSPIAAPSEEEHRPAEEGAPEIVLDAGPEPALAAPAALGPEDLGIAVIGYGGRFPKADDLDAFWEALRAGVDCITEIPRERWDWRSYHDDAPGTPGKSYCKWGGFVSDVDRFDPLFFRLSPRAAHSMDPQERLFLKVAWETLEHAGYTVDRLVRGREAPPGAGRRNRVGVFAGVMWGDYGKHGQDELHKGNPVIASADYSSIANRVSYALNLHGPSIAFDTACSSSLVAIHLACESLRRGECHYAIAGGVSLSLHPAKYLQMSNLKALSAEGKCRSFGAGGAGYVPGEGAGALLLKPLRRAIEDGDHIHAVIRGTAVNHDGKTNGYTVPNPNAQAEVISEALRQGGVDARTISYVEAHGTGTELGDPIEVAGLTKSYRQDTKDRQFCALGSAKSNIGHLEGAAGVVGVIKALLQLKHRQIAPSLHSQQLNPSIDFASSPFWVPQELSAWERPRLAGPDGEKEIPRRAGVSSFGAGGANAHVVLEEWENPPRARPGRDEVLVVLSAMSEERLRAYAGKVAAFLSRAEPDEAAAERRDLERVAYTLQTGREALESRLAILAADHRQLIADLMAYAEGRPGEEPSRVVHGTVKPYELPELGEADLTALEEAVARHDLTTIARRWVAGYAVDWRRLYPTPPPYPLPLPTYPFARDRYWIPVVAERPAVVGAAKALHPYLDTNVSTLEELAFEKTFTSADPVLRDHVVAGQPVLPAVVYLEMARAAGRRAGRAPVSGIHDAVWARPVIAAGDTVTLRISLASERHSVVYRIYSQAEGPPVIHGYGYLATDPPGDARPAASIEALLGRCSRQIAADELYRFFEGLGIQYGPAFRPVEALHCGDREAVALLRLPDAAAAGGDDDGLNPSLLDGALQAIAHLGFDHELEPALLRLPFTLGRLVIRRPLTAPSCYAHAVLTQDSRAGGERVLKFRIDVFDPGGALLVEIVDYSVRIVARGALGQPAPRAAQAARAAPAHTLWYQPVWEATPLPTGHAAAMAGELPERILVLGREDELTSRLVDALSRVRPTRRLVPGTKFSELDPTGYRLDPADPSHYKRALEALSRDGRWSGGSLGVVHLWRYPASAENALAEGLHSLLYLVQSLAAPGETQRVRCLFASGHRDGIADPHDEALAGFAAALAPATPHIELITLQADPTRLHAQELVGILSSELAARDIGPGSEIRYTSATARWTRALRPLEDGPPQIEDAAPLRTGGVYLITGGCGHLGSLFARHLAGRHGARLVLSGRSPSDAAKDALIRELRGLGGEAIYVQADVSDAEAARALVQTAQRRFGGLHGIFHAAGTGEAPPIAQADAASFARVLGPKVQGTLNLDAATRHLTSLELFALFSSLAAVMGDFGAGCYAYANAFMDRFAARREAQRAQGQRHGKTLAMNWPLWAGEGMSLPAGQSALYADVAGMRALDPALGLDLFVRALRADAPQLLVAHGSPERMRRVIERRNPRAAAVAPPAAGIAGEPALEEQRLAEAVEEYLKGHFSAVFTMAADRIDAQANLEDYGIDSIMIVELHARLDRDMAPLPRTTFFELRTVRALADHLVKVRGAEMRRVLGLDRAAKAPAPSNVGAPAPREGAPASLPALDPRPPVSASPDEDTRAGVDSQPDSAAAARPGAPPADDDIAIIGMSGRYPKAPDLDAFWANLKAGRDCIEEIPAERWDHRRYFDPEPGTEGKSYCTWGGFIDDVDKFDPHFFHISPKQVATMDPQERLFLETAWATLEHGGYARVHEEAAAIGVFAGVMWDDYGLLGLEQAALGNHVPAGSDHASIANRVSYAMNLSGPSLTVSTACSSSLLAVHLAVESLRRGECAMAIAGGVNLSLHPSKYTRLCQLQMLAPDGRCRSFGAGGKGYVPGEGVGAVLLKPLKRALADRDTIYAVIKGSAVNHGGKTSGYTVPNPRAQADVIGRALERAGVDGRTVSYVEAHGTGTALGDPIEVGGLDESYRRHTSDRQFCALGSVKSSIGHLECAAGIAAITKVALQLHHRQLVPSLHADSLNPNIDFESTPFYVQRTLDAWRRPDVREGGATVVYPRRAGISSFGAGGTNVHVILEEYQGPAPVAEASRPEPALIVLSAHTEDRLRAYAERLLRFLSSTDGDGGAEPASPPASAPALRDVEPPRIALRDLIARHLRIDPGEIDTDAALSELGLEALDLALLAEQIERRFGVPVSRQQLNGQATLDELSRHLGGGAAPDAAQRRETRRRDVLLKDLAYTLQVGREPRQHRLALLAASVDELIERLGGYCDDAVVDASSSFTGQATRKPGPGSSRQGAQIEADRVRALLEERDLDTLGRLWVTGCHVDWSLLYRTEAPRRIALPTTPFARERYWFSRSAELRPDGRAASEAAPAGTALHPLVGRNTSTFREQRFATTFTGAEVFVADHRIRGRALLPGTAYLEMARAAGELAAERQVRRITSVTWSRPIEVARGPVEATIHLEPTDTDSEFRVCTEDGAVVHAEGRIHLDPEPLASEPPMDLAAIKARCAEHRTREDNYRFLRERGFEYGPAFQAVEAFYDNEREALALLALPEPYFSAFPAGLHPLLLDAAVHSGVLHMRREAAGEGGTPVPFHLDEVILLRPLTSRCYAYLQLRRPAARGARSDAVLDITLLDEGGVPLVKVRGFTGRRLDSADGASEKNSLLFFAEGWQPAPLVEAPGRAAIARVLLLAEDGPRARAFERLVRGQGTDLVWVRPSTTGGEQSARSEASSRPRRAGARQSGDGAGRLTIDPYCAEDHRALLAELEEQGRLPDGIIRLWDASLDGAGATEPGAQPERVEELEELFHLAGALGRVAPDLRARLLLAFHGETPPLALEAASGFCRSLGLVMPGLRASTIQWSHREPASHARELWAELAAGGATPASAASVGRSAAEVCYDSRDRLVRLAVPTELTPEANAGSPALRREGVYLITGGCGGLGHLVAHHLAQRHGAKLLLTGRSPLDDTKERQLARLRAAGGDGIYHPADAADERAMAAAVRLAKRRFGALHGVIHAAGVADKRAVTDKTWAEFHANLRPKVEGTVVLDRLTAGEPLDFFALFSSTSALLGDFGACDYATGNRFQMAYGAYRERLRHEGRRQGVTLVMNWPLWRDGGMGGRAESEQTYLKTSGLDYLETDAGLATFERILHARRSPITVFYGKPSRVARALGVEAPPRAASAPEAAAPVHAATPARRAPEPARPIEAASTASTQPELRDVIIDAIVDVLHQKRGVIAPDINIAEYGFDSLSMAKFAGQLGRRLGLSLPPLMLFEHTTVREIEGYLEQNHGAELRARLSQEARDAAPASPPASSAAASPPASPGGGSRLAGARRSSAARPSQGGDSSGDIAIIGVGGRYPKADDLRTFWSRIKAGESCIEEIPAGRWDKELYFDPRKARSGTTASKWGGFLEGVDQFDPLFFNLPPNRARLMDPMQRLFLESVYETIEDAGYTRGSLSAGGGKVGVYAGAMYNHYAMLAGDEATRGYLLATCGASIANHVAYFLNLHGPCLTVDTACASSLTAVHLACESLHLGHCEMAIAGGVNLSLIPQKYVGLSELQFLSGSNLSRPFGDSDGMVPGEGVGSVLLKPLDRAVRDRDHIYGVIKSSAISHGGTSTGMTVPNLKAQADLFVEALERAGIDPRTISYVEAAANGSALGDPIEVNALTRAFRRSTADTGFCAIGTVKSNIGHLEAASGISQLTKVLLQLQHGELAPTINSEPRNPRLQLDGTPFRVQDRLEEWRRPVIDGREVPRRALINAFGAGGGYATLLVEEHRQPPRLEAQAHSPAGPPEVFVFSAKSRKSLHDLAARVLRFIDEAAVLSLEDMAYTLQVGREAMEERIAVVAATRDALLAALGAYVRDPDAPAPGLFSGRVDLDEAPAGGAVRPPTEPVRGREEAARLWVGGATIDWEALYPHRAAHRITLPTYPFDRRRCWLDPSPTSETPAPPAASPSEPRRRSEARAAPAIAGAPDLESYLCDRVAAALGLYRGELTADASLRRFGLDSITTAKLKVTLEDELAVIIPMEVMSGARNVAELAEHLSARGARAPRGAAKHVEVPADGALWPSDEPPPLNGKLRTQFLAFHHDLTGVADEHLVRLYASLREDT
ncbi:SDR family NAD(P)-dependent oxidoreductase [Sorangium sp. So ce362]|uniref:SDR family NAD(P)-dependent oxidoreductase n=1 Tax=Sorangium sp. So ce362 TaxID=3133303 RepID=UPI003F5FC033